MMYEEQKRRLIAILSDSLATGQWLVYEAKPHIIAGPSKWMSPRGVCT